MVSALKNVTPTGLPGRQPHMLPSGTWSNPLKLAYVLVSLLAITQLLVTLLSTSNQSSHRVPAASSTLPSCASSPYDTGPISLPPTAEAVVVAIFVFDGDTHRLTEALRCFLAFMDHTPTEVIVVGTLQCCAPQLCYPFFS